MMNKPERRRRRKRFFFFFLFLFSAVTFWAIEWSLVVVVDENKWLPSFSCVQLERFTFTAAVSAAGSVLRMSTGDKREKEKFISFILACTSLVAIIAHLSNRPKTPRHVPLVFAITPLSSLLILLSFPFFFSLKNWACPTANRCNSTSPSIFLQLAANCWCGTPVVFFELRRV